MNTKKIATTLGTGTLGAGGAGAAAWNLGLFGGNGLEMNVDHQQIKGDPTGHTSASKDSLGDVGGKPGEGGEIAPSQKIYFRGATNLDNTAIGQSSGVTWNVTVSQGGKVSMVINTNKIENERNWRCELKAIILGNPGAADRSEFNRQGKELLEKIKKDEDKRKQFVKNCAEARVDSEKNDGGTSKIYLETEKTAAPESKFRFKDRDLEDLLNKDFTGVYKLGDRGEEIADSQSWEIKETIVGDQKKITIDTIFNAITGSESYTRTPWNCSICGRPKSEKKFKKNTLDDFLKVGDFGDEPVKLEKKRYLIRNCLKNNGEIKGMEIQESGNDWEFKNLEKITEGMYENPIQQKTNPV